MRLASGTRLEALQQDDVVPDVGVVIGVGRVDHAGVGGKTSGANAGSAGEGVDFEAGVVGEHQLAGSKVRVVDGLEGCVVGEGDAVLFRREDV